MTAWGRAQAPAGTSAPDDVKGCEHVERLGQDRFEKALAFVNRDACALDRAVARWLFRQGDVRDAVDELAAVQNSDGGFGHGLEPDFALRASSVLATTVGLQYADLLGLSTGHPIVAAAVGYLVDHYDPTRARWAAVPEAVNDVPHAPWWSVDRTTKLSGVEGSWANPNAEVVGWLWRHRRLVPAALLDRVMAAAREALVGAPSPMDMHDLLCWARWATALGDEAPRAATERLLTEARAVVAKDVRQWAAYGAKPLSLAPAPNSILFPAVQSLTNTNLDWEIGQQQPDGSWRPTWSWGQYPEAWARAEVAWAGRLTVDTLRTLGAYGRLACSEVTHEPLAVRDGAVGVRGGLTYNAGE